MRSTVSEKGFVNSIPDQRDLFEVLVPSKFSSSVSVTVASVTTNTTLSSPISIVDASTGNVIVTLPDAATYEGVTFTVKKIDNSPYTVSVRTSSNQKIDGETEQIISSQWTSMSIVAFSGNWYLV